MPFKLVGSREWDLLPKIYRRNIRFNFTWDWERPRRYLFLGITETGKSTTNEIFALRHPKIVDFFGSRDNENLCWCRKTSPIDDILLVHGDNVTIKGSWDTKKISDLKIEDINSHECTVTCNSFWSDQKTRYQGIQGISDIFYNRLQWKEKDIIYGLFRETMNLIYARISQGLGEKEAKADVLMFLRELRHFGISFGGDILRWTGIDKEMRDLADFTIIKALGWQSLPNEIAWLYSIVDPKTFSHLKIDEFIALKRDASIAYCNNPPLEFHKEEGVDLIKELGLQLEYGEEIVDSSEKIVGDKEHANIVKVYHETPNYRTISKILHRSIATIGYHLNQHNDEIKKQGKCDKCARVGSDLSDVELYIKH